MPDPIAIQPDAAGESPSKPWRGSGTVLVVDDEPMVRVVMTAVLAAAGFEVLEAGDGREGLRVFREHGVEIRAVFLDLSMPRMNGEEAFAEMRRSNPSIPVVLLSGLNERDSVDRFPDDGPAGFLSKPFKPAALLEKVREVLAAAGAQEAGT